jgi:lipopolysaccharide/colanic/teichoic acid biosynthesis glycosyltransferase
MKRVLDLVFAALGLLLFLPGGLLIAAVLRFTGEGEIFYRQMRIGRDGRPFGLLKFATMLKNSPTIGSGSITLKNDPRVLPAGRVLRKTKLNEVPQLWNILRGEMSVVGPRPMTREDFGYYPPEVARRIVSVPPGLTGLGSVVFRDEETVIAGSPKHWLDCYKEDISPHKGELEQWYIDHQSLFLDLRLVFLTACVVFFPTSRFYRRLLPGIPRRPGDAGSTVGAGGIRPCPDGAFTDANPDPDAGFRVLPLQFPPGGDLLQGSGPGFAEVGDPRRRGVRRAPEPPHPFASRDP